MIKKLDLIRNRGNPAGVLVNKKKNRLQLMSDKTKRLLKDLKDQPAQSELKLQSQLNHGSSDNPMIHLMIKRNLNAHVGVSTLKKRAHSLLMTSDLNALPNLLRKKKLQLSCQDQKRRQLMIPSKPDKARMVSPNAPRCHAGAKSQRMMKKLQNYLDRKKLTTDQNAQLKKREKRKPNSSVKERKTARKVTRRRVAAHLLPRMKKLSASSCAERVLARSSESVI